MVQSKSYLPPIIEDLEDMFEPVYATGSGGEQCWSIDYSVPQDWNGQGKVIEVKCHHTKNAWHTAKGLIVTLMFDKALTSAFAENPTDYDVKNYGNSVVITRNLFADGFNSGDEVTFKVFVNAGDEALTKVTQVIGKEISCIRGS